MGLGIVEFHKDYEKNEFHVVKRKKDVEYYYVEEGFFEVQHSIGKTLLTLLHISFAAALYVLITQRLWELLIIGM